MEAPSAIGRSLAGVPGDRPVATMPAQLLHGLRDAILVGDKTQIDQLIGTIRELDVQLARTFQELADRYECDTLSLLLARREQLATRA